MVNAQQLKGTWNDLLGQVREQWGSLTDDDLKVMEGNIEQLAGRIQKRTGEARDSIVKTLNDMADSGQGMAARAAQSVSQATDYAKGYVREGLTHAASNAGEGYQQARQFVRHRPAESLTVVFGVGLGVGLLLGLSLRSR